MTCGFTRRATLAALLFAFVAGCGGSGNRYELPVGSDDGGGETFVEGDASAGGPLDAAIEENHIAVTFVTLRCSGDCADVEAVATGGQPPYAFVWEDGSTTPARRVCPTSSTNYHVKVTDTGRSGELARPPESVGVSLTANVLACPDAGADAGAGCVPIAGGAQPSSSTVVWASWLTASVGTPGSATGQLAAPSGAIDVAYTGEVNFLTQTNAGGDDWTASAYTSATVSNGPTGPGIIALAGGTTNANTIVFSRPVDNPLLAVFSLGSALGSVSASYEFASPFTILSSGSGQNALTQSPVNVLTGIEGDGVIQFSGTCSSIRFTDPVYENFSGFTIGLRAAP